MGPAPVITHDVQRVPWSILTRTLPYSLEDGAVRGTPIGASERVWWSKGLASTYSIQVGLSLCRDSIDESRSLLFASESDLAGAAAGLFWRGRQLTLSRFRLHSTLRPMDSHLVICQWQYVLLVATLSGKCGQAAE